MRSEQLALPKHDPSFKLNKFRFKAITDLAQNDLSLTFFSLFFLNLFSAQNSDCSLEI